MTIFSKIIAGDIPCAKVHEDNQTFAFMDAGQVNPGHVIVALKRPAETILDLSDDEAGALFRTARKIAVAVQAAFSPDGLTILQANKPAGWQTVPHVHLHVLPRHDNDAVGLEWPRNEPSLEELKALAGKLNIA